MLFIYKQDFCKHLYLKQLNNTTETQGHYKNWEFSAWILISLARLVWLFSSSLSHVWVSILPVFKCKMGCVPEAGCNSQWCPSDPCPSKLWQKELLFSHRPGGPCPLGEASPRDWQLRKHSQPQGDWVRAHCSDALIPPLLSPSFLPLQTSHFSVCPRWPGPPLTSPHYLHLTHRFRSHLCWSEVFFLTLLLPEQPPAP